MTENVELLQKQRVACSNANNYNLANYIQILSCSSSYPWCCKANI